MSSNIIIISGPPTRGSAYESGFEHPSDNFQSRWKSLAVNNSRDARGSKSSIDFSRDTYIQKRPDDLTNMSVCIIYAARMNYDRDYKCFRIEKLLIFDALKYYYILSNKEM